MIISSAPTRIDLAGGTLDIWPLYLFFDNPPTLNAAINLYARVELQPRRDKKLIVQSRDLGIRARFSSLDRLPDTHPLILILKLLRFYRPQTGLELVTDCQAPAGSGIGGSSALNIALNGALNQLTGRGYSRAQMIEIAKNIETQVIQVPAGNQDYYAAMYGGVQAVQPGPLKIESKKIKLDLADWTSRFVLCFTGKPRQSGINNWAVTKQALDKNVKVRNNLSKIARIAKTMEQELRHGRFHRFAALFAEEWQVRKSLAPGIRTAGIDRLIRVARRQGALAAKVCGAGGGGCVAFYVNPGQKQRVMSALTQNGGRVLDFKFVARGLRVCQAPSC